MKSSTFCGQVIAAAVLIVASTATYAQSFPISGKPLRIVLPASAGSPPDVLARAIAPKLAAELAVAAIVENKPGAGFILGTMEVVKAAPDGHTILLAGSSAVAMRPHTVAKLPYDPFNDLTPIMFVTRVPLVFVGSLRAPFSNFAEFVQHARANPGKSNFGTMAVGTGFDIVFEQVKYGAKIDVPIIPHKGATELVQGLLSGDIHVGLLGGAQAVALRKGGKLRALAVADDQRIDALPDVPTFSELGRGDVNLRGSLHLFGPAKMARAVVDRLNEAWQKTLQAPEIVGMAQTQGLPIVGGPPEVSVTYLRAQHERWGEVVRALGIKPQ